MRADGNGSAGRIGKGGVGEKAGGVAQGSAPKNKECPLELAWPPSVNTIWRTIRVGRGFKVVLSPAGRAFYELAQRQVSDQRNGARFDDGDLEVTIWLYPPDRRKADIDNRIKTLLDACTKGGLWTDDNQVAALHVYRGDVIQNGAAHLLVRKLHSNPTENTP